MNVAPTSIHVFGDGRFRSMFRFGEIDEPAYFGPVPSWWHKLTGGPDG